MKTKPECAILLTVQVRGKDVMKEKKELERVHIFPVGQWRRFRDCRRPIYIYIYIVENMVIENT